MIIKFLSKYKAFTAWFLFFVFYMDLVSFALVQKKQETLFSLMVPTRNNNFYGNTAVSTPFIILNNESEKVEKPNIKKVVRSNKHSNNKKPFIGGPGQPEMGAFQSVNANNMVDLFSGDFSYNVPLLDVGGYPIGLSYRSGISMDQEASWVGLGWNINPGTVSRNVRGLPDDFNGTEKITKQYNIKKNWTAGISASVKPEIIGFDIPKFSGSVGAFYNNYSGIGFEIGAGATVNAGKYLTTSKTTNENTSETKIDSSFSSKFSASLSFNLNSQQGLNLDASLMMKSGKEESKYNGAGRLGASYNSRSGLQDLQLSMESNKSETVKKNGKVYEVQSGSVPVVDISFAKSSYTPSITMPFSHLGFTLTLKGGTELFGFHALAALKGYYSQQFIAKNDRSISLPAYGYMYYNKGNKDESALLDFNREKDIPFRTQTPHAAIPVYTYDTYSISGEGIGGSFRPYRGDVGYMRDHVIKTKNGNGNIGIDFGAGPNLGHFGGNIQLTYATVTSRRWLLGNLMERRVQFNDNDSTYEAVYFRNPGEQTTNTQDYYDKIGGDDVVRIGMAGSNIEPVATPVLKKFDKQKSTGSVNITSPIIKTKRDKRSQVISYLTAEEAQQVGLDTVIKSYPINVFPKGKCDRSFEVITRNDGSGGIRKPNHISEITVLNNDGRRYIYGIPAYNLGQKEVTFAVDKNNANVNTGLVSYTPNTLTSENSVGNNMGKDNFFSSDSTPAFAHSFLLTGLLSPDYVDITGDGVTEDDNGDAVKFNYSRMKWNGSKVNFKWRAPYEQNKASYNEGLKTDKTDDKGNYIYGEKEIWYVNSIESKTMIATFTLDNTVRKDDYGVIGENGGRDANYSLKRLKEINLYSKSDYYKNPLKARPVKTVKFHYSYKLCVGSQSSESGSGKLTLDSLSFSYNGNKRSEKNKYKFTYHANNPTYNNKSYDRWGNYKPDTDNPNNIPNADYPYSVQDKTKADNNVGAWNLSQVALPSGAKINVTYESDNYGYVQNKKAMGMCKIAGMGDSNDPSTATSVLYASANQDNKYVFISVPSAVTSREEIYQKYLEGVEKIYFKMSVKMPSDILGSGYEMIPFYAEYEDYGTTSSPNKIWIKLKEFGKQQVSPAIAAIQFLRLNLPSKAYPGSDVNGEANFRAITQSIMGMWPQFKEAIIGFNKYKRISGICKSFDSTRSYLRLNNPETNKFGGGLRVRKIVISDNWNAMTGQKESYYGQEYDYSTTKEVFYDSAGVKKVKTIKVSSGVASYEPNIGNEENPLRQPIEFQESVTLAPTDYLYSEYPYCETYFPSPSVGYSKVTVSSINKKNLKSFNGWEETEFYTSKDFPTITDYTTFDSESRKRGKRKFNFLNSLSLRRTTLSQGFKIELNDMSGKVKAQKSYAANDSVHPVAYTLNYFRTTTDNVHGTTLLNTVAVMDSSNGKINPNGTVGKDIELMMDFREQQALSIGVDVNLNAESFVLFTFPVTIPAFFPKTNIDDNRFRSAVTLKILQRYGILDSVIHYEKGSLISTKNMVFDSETGDVLLSRTQNEFNDPIYNFNYPAHWRYSGMEPAYKNISALYKNISIVGGKINYTANYGDIERNLESGDEIWVSKAGLPQVGCIPPQQLGLAASAKRLWVVDINKTTGQVGRQLYLMDRFGNPYNGLGASLKIIRSGKRNVPSASIGSVTSLRDPIDKTNPLLWQLKMDSTIGVIATGAGVYKDFWNVDNRYVSEYRCDTLVKIDSNTFSPILTALQKKAIKSDGGWVNELINNTQLYPPYLAASYEYQHFLQASQRDCKSRKRNCAGWTNSIHYTTRGIVQYNLNTIPPGATIISANINLTSKIPSGLWNHASVNGTGLSNCGNYWPSGITNAHDYFDRSLYPDGEWNNAGLIRRVTAPWGTATKLEELNFSNSNQVALQASKASNVNYVNTACTQLLQDYINQPSYGLVIMQANETDNGCNRDQVRHLSFCGGLNAPPPGEGSLPNISNCSGPTISAKYSYQSITCKDTCVSIFNRRINPYVQGILGNWRMNKSYTFFDSRKDSVPSNPTDIRRNGEFRKFVSFWNFGSPQVTESNYSRWVWNSEVTRFNKRGLEIENKDPLGRFNSGLYGYNQTLPVAIAQNAKYRQIAFEGFEDYLYKNDSCDQRCPPARQFDFSFYKAKIDSTERHTGKSSFKLNAGETIPFNIAVTTFSSDSVPGALSAITNAGCPRIDSITVNNNILTPVFSPLQGDDLIVSAWVKEARNCKCNGYVNNQLQLIYSGNSGTIGSPVILKPTGNIIEGWQRYEEKITVPSTATSIQMSIMNTSSGGTATGVYFDDIRLHPFNSNMKSFVYNPVNLRLMSELDENNYASFYEYDDEGTLVRVKKETQQGIKTIQETRSVLLKQ
jgi:hypothetical protein